MRPIYETAIDRLNEVEVVSRLATLAGAKAVKLPHKYPLDFALVKNGKVIRWVEIKCRTNNRDKYPDYLLSLSKLQAITHLYGFTGIKAILVIRWTDQVGVAKIPVEYRIQIGGRTDRNDTQDMEPCAMISIDQFEPVGVA